MVKELRSLEVLAHNRVAHHIAVSQVEIHLGHREACTDKGIEQLVAVPEFVALVEIEQRLPPVNEQGMVTLCQLQESVACLVKPARGIGKCPGEVVVDDIELSERSLIKDIAFNKFIGGQGSAAIYKVVKIVLDLCPVMVATLLERRR